MCKRIRYWGVVATFLFVGSVKGMQLVSLGKSVVHALCPLCLWDYDRQTKALLQAIETDNDQKIKFLVRDRGVSPNTPFLCENSNSGSNHWCYDSDSGRNCMLPLVLAAHRGKVAAVDRLLQEGADPNSQMISRTRESYPTALIAVCAQQGLSAKSVALIVSCLLAHGADPKRSCYFVKTEKQAKPSEDPIVIQYSVDALSLANNNGYTEAAAIINSYVNPVARE